MIYTFYGRVSSDSDNQLSALENQEKYWIDFFKSKNMKMNSSCGAFYSRDGKLVTRSGYYIDEGISGYKSKKYRKAFMKMIADARLKKFDMIYTRSISRFGRNTEDIITVINELKRFNIGVYFEDINANTLDRNDDFKIHIFMGLAQEESRLKSSSVQKGKIVSAKNGVWSGSAPYGYDIYSGEMEIDGVLKYVKGRLIINESEATVVRTVFNLYLNEGWGVSRIAKHLNQNNTPRKRKASKWDQSIIGKMLCNPIYKGTFWLHRTYKKDPQQNIVAEVPEDEQIIRFKPELQIIETEMFEKVQEQKKIRFEEFGDFRYKEVKEKDELGNEIVRRVRSGIDRKSGRYSGAHLFSNLLRCGNCGSPLRYKKQRSTSTVHHYWFCSNNDRMGKCQFRNLQRNEELEEWVKKEIEMFKSDNWKHNDILESMMKLQFNSLEIEQKIFQLEIQVQEMKAESDMNLNVHVKGYISEEEYAERAGKLTKQINKVNEELNRLRAADQERLELVNRFNRFINNFKKIDTENLTNVILRSIIVNIVFTTNDPELNAGAALGMVDLPEERKINWRFMNESLDDLEYEYTKKYFQVGEYENIDPWTLLPVK